MACPQGAPPGRAANFVPSGVKFFAGFQSHNQRLGYQPKYDFCTGRKFHFLGQALQVSAQNQSLGRVAPQVL